MTRSNWGELHRSIKAANIPKRWEESVLRDARAHVMPGDEMRLDNDWLAKRCAVLRSAARGVVPIHSTIDELRTLADEIVSRMIDARLNHVGDTRGKFNAEHQCQLLGVRWPGKARAECPRWWRRKLLADLNRRTETLARHLAHVGGRGPAYVSDETHRRFCYAKKNAVGMLESADVVCESDGEMLKLADCVKASVSNPKVRHAEMMTRIKGMESVALTFGHVGLFWTWTLPTSHHPIRADGSRNSRWSGVTARASASNLITKYAHVRALLAKNGITVYGLRVMEPHKSGTPHGHMLMWCAPEHREAVLMTVATVFTRDLESMPNYLDHELKDIMVKCEQIDATKGSAVAYVAKYISKNIGDDFDLNDKKMGVSRVLAWASAHRIRQFQFSGGPTIGSWRECRRVPEKEVELDEVLTDAFKCVHKSDDEKADFGRFIEVQGGMFAKRKDRPLRVVTRPCQAPNGYGEYFKPRIAGLQVPRFIVETRLRRWRVEFGSASRTRFNNCNRSVAFSVERPVESVLSTAQSGRNGTIESSFTSGLKSSCPVKCDANYRSPQEKGLNGHIEHDWERLRDEILRADADWRNKIAQTWQNSD